MSIMTQRRVLKMHSDSKALSLNNNSYWLFAQFALSCILWYYLREWPPLLQ